MRKYFLYFKVDLNGEILLFLRKKNLLFFIFDRIDMEDMFEVVEY